MYVSLCVPVHVSVIEILCAFTLCEFAAKSSEVRVCVPVAASVHVSAL